MNGDRVVDRGANAKFGDDGVLVTGEESGTIWLWAFPELLDWPREITWLFSPVTGSNRAFPGDLWGIDKAGELLVVEAKRIIEKSPSCNPFADHYLDGKVYIGERTSVEEIREEWKSKLKKERRSMELRDPEKKRSLPGVLPYSVRREILLSWPGFERRLHSFVMSSAYREAVDAALNRRSAAANPITHIVGFATTCIDAAPRLNPAGLASYRRLIDSSGRDRIHLAGARARRVGQTSQVSIESAAFDLG